MDGAYAEEIGLLFDEIANKRNGTVTSAEVATVLPFTAGAAMRDLLMVVDEMKQKKLELDKKKFTRFLTKRIYSCWNSHLNQHENVSLSHVIITLKRRRHMKTFSEFYLSRGVAGAQLVGPEAGATAFKASRQGASRLALDNNEIESSVDDALKGVTNRGLTKEELHDQWLWSQRKEAVHACRTFKSAMQSVFAIVFNQHTRRLERHVVVISTRGAQVYSSRYFVVLVARDAGKLAIACTSYLGGPIYLSRKRGCPHGAPPDIVLTSAIFTPKDNKDVSVGLAEPNLQEPPPPDARLPFSALRTAPLDAYELARIAPPNYWFYSLHALHVEHVSCGHGAITFSSNGALYEWSSREAVHHYCFYVSQRAYILEDDATPADIKAVLVADTETMCSLWTEAKVKMGPRSVQNELKHIKAVATGHSFSTALTTDGQVYAWGQGIGIANPTGFTTPRKLSGFAKPITKIICGVHHVLGADSLGIAYAWGCNAHGQLGQGHLDDSLEPEPVRLLKDRFVIDIAAGDDHSVFLTDVGDVFSCGNNWSGQLGLPGVGHISTPSLVEFPPECADPIYLLQAMGATTAAVSVTGAVFQWGLCAVPLLGLVARHAPQRLLFSSMDTNKAMKGFGVLGDQDPVYIITGLALAAGAVVLTTVSTPYSSLVPTKKTGSEHHT
ncbi:hypothetical protein ACHHYP_13264 [Achlya hypogyna]|uniref:Regulator of chromosome condensation (RCC1)-like protein n=1 Tax=Achlya hypogyna TaxID=1202772 RepID=A0A1V9YFL0_ACHHY|nr:hypothetical protein ACHHYP_13264 [Achlya hypogyna]